MFKSILCITICLRCVHCEKFDPKEMKYCDQYCIIEPTKEKVIHTACNCKAGEAREEVELDKYTEFRRVVLEEHNKLRNKIASGQDTRNGASSAANMVALSYDLELEYMVRCYLRSRFNGNHDKCRLLRYNRDAGQNLAGQNIKDYSMDLVKELINGWYEEIRFLEPDIIDRFHLLNDDANGTKEIAHFTSLVWADNNRVGCARLYTPDPVKLNYMYEEAFRQTLLCNYGITILKDRFADVNALRSTVYKRGKPCSQCPENFKCNSRYPALCGEIEPIPTDPPYDFDAKDDPQDPKKGGKRGDNSTASKSFNIAPFLVIPTSCLLLLNIL